MNSKQAFGERLKSARLALGFSLRDLASKIGTTAQTLSNYEQGKIMPRSPVIIALAQALKVKVEFFFRPITISLSRLEFRKKNALLKKEQNKILATIYDWLERYHQVESLFPEITQTKTISEEAMIEIDNESQVEDIVLDVRKKWNLGLSPISNMVALLEDHGIKIVFIQAAESFDACAFWAAGNPGIVVKKGMPGDRLRFNLAHELGHLILKTPEKWNKRQREKATMRFAGAFLVPAVMVRKELGDKRNHINLEELYYLKHKYGLSMSAWVYRAKDLGIFSKVLAQRFYMMFRHEGWMSNEPGDPYPPEPEPTRLKQLVYRAFAEGIISETKAAELLGQKLLTFRQEILNKNA